MGKGLKPHEVANVMGRQALEEKRATSQIYQHFHKDSGSKDSVFK
jgi:hypothetical protein